MALTVGSRIVRADPEKSLFISMLVRDIELIRAIIDLVDNCVDGARRLRKKGSFRGLWVDVQTTPKEFRISDNCGGISIDLARNYAFRFGRPEDMPRIARSVGEFGVGMKRALFKLGNKFEVVSSTKTSRFVVEEDVQKWRQKDEWEFEFKELEEEPGDSPGESGTRVVVTRLHPSVSDEFSLANFETRLVNQLEAAHQESLEKGLEIRCNGTTLGPTIPKLLRSRELRPAYRTLQFADGHKPMTVKMYAGIAASDPEEAGWDVFCNGRLVLDSDQTRITGWGEGGETRVPKYHPQFARFRAYAFFDCDDASVLPWNTTKTGVDENSRYYQATRLQMIDMMRPVITFLNKLDAEKEREGQPLQTAVEKARAVRLSQLRPSDSFVSPVTPAIAEERLVQIRYKRPRQQVDHAKKALGVTTASDVGEKTFDYFYRLEVQD